MTTPTPQDIARAIAYGFPTDWQAVLTQRIATALAAERSRLDDEFARARDIYLGKIDQLEAERSRGQAECERLRNRIDTRLNDCLCEMKEGYDDSIVGFNEAWDVVRKVFAESALAQPATAEHPKEVMPNDRDALNAPPQPAPSPAGAMDKPPSD